MTKKRDAKREASKRQAGVHGVGPSACGKSLLLAEAVRSARWAGNVCVDPHGDSYATVCQILERDRRRPK